MNISESPSLGVPDPSVVSESSSLGVPNPSVGPESPLLGIPASPNQILNHYHIMPYRLHEF